MDSLGRRQRAREGDGQTVMDVSTQDVFHVMCFAEAVETNMQPFDAIYVFRFLMT